MKFNNAAKKIDTAFERIKDQEAKVRVYTEVAVSVFKHYYAVYWLNFI